MEGGKAVRRKVVRKPKKSAKRSPKKSAKRSPKKSAKRSPKKSPKRSQKKSAKRSPKKSPKRSPKKSPKRSPKKSPKRSPQNRAQRMPQRTVPRRVERVAGHCDTLFRQINHLGPNAPIRATDVENTYAFIDNFHPETKWKGPIQIQGHTFYIDTNKNPINCGSFGCGYLSSRNDFNKTLVVKVLKICPNVPQMNQEE
jgi:outer membrane biosynthesis protein TonB